jgi:hypothetical protein
MNLKQTIEELEQQARQYQQAADALRAIGQNGSAPEPAPTQKAAKPANQAASKGNKAKKKPKVSEETRAKISQALKAAHAAKKAAAQ